MTPLNLPGISDKPRLGTTMGKDEGTGSRTPGGTNAQENGNYTTTNAMNQKCDEDISPVPRMRGQQSQAGHSNSDV